MPEMAIFLDPFSERKKWGTWNFSFCMGEIKKRIHNAQYAAFRAINKELITLYWDIGRMIVERQKGRPKKSTGPGLRISLQAGAGFLIVLPQGLEPGTL
jgi:hypothetical protein